MPGGPIDPNRILSLIKGGAPWRDDGIVVGGAHKRLVPNSGIWQTANEGHHLSAATYDVLKNCTPAGSGRFSLRVAGSGHHPPAGNVFTLAGITYQLASTMIGGVPWAVHQTV